MRVDPNATSERKPPRKASECGPACFCRGADGWMRGLNQKTIDRLKEHARLNGRSREQEVRARLERAAGMVTMDEAARVSEQWRHRLGGPSFDDSTQLVREDRDSR